MIGRAVVAALEITLAGFGILAIIGLYQVLQQPEAQAWFILGLSLIAVSCGALALALWRMPKARIGD